MEKLSEVIQALECCIVNEDEPCDNCPYNGDTYCVDSVMADALELLKEYASKMAEGRSNANAEH